MSRDGGVHVLLRKERKSKDDNVIWERSTGLHTLVDNRTISLDETIFLSIFFFNHVLARCTIVLDLYTVLYLMSHRSIRRHESRWNRQDPKGRHSRSKGWRMGILGWIQSMHVLNPRTLAWADGPPRWQLSSEEQKAIVNAHGNLDAIRASGVRLAGQKFFTLQANERSVYGKKGASTTETRIAALLADPLPCRLRLMGVFWSRQSKRSWSPSTLHHLKHQKRHPSSRA
ncbi:hypothetical protein JVT61DRAFT_9784 [Boletus reticuloceps]|uniref:Uncharacterized protein n=1 Tax=Boletus reticuloceps TaxID=495285 RepID=A0A8I3A5P1_9AGAM|nr:hypothetical protein JVT61DRAFT_9784 [Boletus reticuloceps]